MRLTRQLLAGFCFSLFLLLTVAHAQQASPYTVAIPVKDTSEQARDQAFGEGLGQVLARVAGGQDLRGKAGYGDVIKGATSLVQQYRYTRNAPNVSTGVSLSITFDQAAVQRAIAQMGVATAGVKPPVLLVVRGEDHRVLDKSALATLGQTVASRGYGVVLADPDQVGDTPTVSSVDPEEVMALAKQYHTGLILVGQVHGNGNSADWNLISGGPQQRWSTQSPDGNTMQADAGNNLADRLGKQLNMIGTSNVDGKLWVVGLNSAMDYANLLSVLHNDPMVHQVTTLNAQGDGMLFSIKAGLPIDALSANLTASGRLLQGQAHEGADASLRWLH
ncbi:DUF2066 domain-containing protein [Dyella sp.]|uniref:DUF2066 domain-containing protein n=1 Tax=Dyella sp. TaxID=1869338 RepID=UPI002ED1EFCC